MKFSRASNFSCSCAQASLSTSMASCTSFNPNFVRIISTTLEPDITRPPVPPIPAPTSETTSPAPKVKGAAMRPAIERTPPTVPKDAPVTVDIFTFLWCSWSFVANSCSCSLVFFLFGIHSTKALCRSSRRWRNSSNFLVISFTTNDSDGSGRVASSSSVSLDEELL